MDRKELEKLFNQCDHFLYGRGPQPSSPHRMLPELAKMTSETFMPDVYGSGSLIETFEKDVAALLGKPAAVFMPSGTMAQQIALRIWSERTGRSQVAFHPTCHLEIHEQMGYRYLHGLQGVPVGSPHDLITLEDLKKLSQPLGSLLIELPQREIGGLLPAWEDLKALTDWAREQGIHLHMDGARLWECKPFYQRDYAEIAGFFDSVYVSMYKGLGAIAGSVLVGPEDFIAESRIWLRRHGGNLVSMYPFILSARFGLETYLPRMEQYHQKALEVAELLSRYERVKIKPNPPQTNMMHLFLEGEIEKLEQALLDTAREQKTLLFRGFWPTQVPGIYKTELTILDASLKMTRDEIVKALDYFFNQ